MQIKVEFRRYEKQNVVGFANVTLDDSIIIKGITVMKGRNGHFISFPSKKGSDGKWREIVHPLTKELRLKIQTAIFEKANLTTGNLNDLNDGNGWVDDDFDL